MEEDGTEGIILGCTEIPLPVKQKDVNVPIFDTMEIHREAAIKHAIEKQASLKERVIMKNQRSAFIALIISCLLFAAPAHSKPPAHIDINKMNAYRAVLDKYSFLNQPYSFYYFHNIDKLDLRLDQVRRTAPLFSLKEPEGVFGADYTFRGQKYTLDDYFERNFVLGFLVLQNDQIMLEKYFHESGPKSRFLSNSVIKSIVSVLAGIAIEEGKIKSSNDLARQYLPYLAHSGFKNVTVKQLLQMASGIRWNENYLDPKADFNWYLESYLHGAPPLAELAASCESAEPPGKRFEYQSINTQVLGQIIEAAAGKPLNEYCQEKLWRQLGADSDAFFFRSKKQPQIPAAAAFCATLRDYARFGLMMMNGGSLGECRIVSKNWVDESTTTEGASELPAAAGPNDNFAENLGYAYQWWLLDGGVFMALGVYGQAIYINPACQVVIVQTSAWPEPDTDSRWDEMLKVMSTVAEKLHPREDLTQLVWNEYYPFYRKILNLPFNRELLSGELDEQIFKDYIIQDYHFLVNYKKVYEILLAKAPDKTAATFIKDMIDEIDEEVKCIHNIYIKKLGISKEELLNSPLYPATEFYNSFLVKTAVLEPFEVGLMAMLPCHWIYYQLATDMKQAAEAKNNKYQEWIDGYWEGSWENSETKRVVAFTEKYMRSTTDENRLKMKKAYKTAMKLEYMFWDGIYRKVQWIE